MDYETIRTVCSVAGLLLFFAFFVVMLAWIYRPGTRKAYADAANIPFKKDR